MYNGEYTSLSNRVVLMINRVMIDRLAKGYLNSSKQLHRGHQYRAVYGSFR